MDVISKPNQQAINGRGVCPHCNYPSYFKMEGSAQICERGSVYYIRCITECQNCHDPILLIGKRTNSHFPYDYSEHFPIGKPNESIPDEIPEIIGTDFKEALRCQFVNAHRATATMCRRALQSSCQDLGADGDRLVDQIDDLAQKGSITRALQDMAHTVRLIGNVGAHPDEDGLEDVGPDDASDLIEFSLEFYNHVYVMPEKLKKMSERRNAAQTNPQGEPAATEKT